MSTEKLRHVLGGEELRWLWERIHARVLRGEACRGKVRLESATERQRDALVRLLGHPFKGTGLTVSLEELETVLRDAGISGGLPEAAALVLGVSADEIREERSESRAEWEALWNWAKAEPSLPVREVLLEPGLLKRLTAGDVGEARKLGAALKRLAERLPVEGIPLAQLAAEVARDSHSLDEDRPLGVLGVRLAARMGGTNLWQGAEERREAWARVGVLCDELSAPALVLNVWSDDDSFLGESLRAHSRAGDPTRLSIRQLVRGSPSFDVMKGLAVLVCENPSVVASVADAFGPRGGSVVCTEGMPKTAANLLLNRLRAAGAELCFHVDFDWAGIVIGNLLASRHAAKPLQMDTDDYLAAAGGPPLIGAAVDASWAADLRRTMQDRGVAVHEEQVLRALLSAMDPQLKSDQRG